MIQDIGNHTYHVEYHPVLWHRMVFCCLIRVARSWSGLPGKKSLPTLSTAIMLMWIGGSSAGLFAEDKAQFYLAKEALPERDGFAYVSINFMRAARPRYLAFAGIARPVPAQLGTVITSFAVHCGRPMVHSEVNAWYTVTIAIP